MVLNKSIGRDVIELLFKAFRDGRLQIMAQKRGKLPEHCMSERTVAR